MAARRGDRRHVHLAVPRTAHLHDGRPAQHHVLHPPAVLGQEHRAHGRPRHQYRRDRALYDQGRADRVRAAESRYHELHAAGGAEDERKRIGDERPECAHPDRRGRGAAVAAAALQSRDRRLRGRDRRARRRGRYPAAGKHARPCRARLDAAGPVRHRAVPPAAGAAGDQVAADHHADRARRGERARARACDRRRRLHRQAVLGAGTAGADPLAAAPRRAPSGSPTC